LDRKLAIAEIVGLIEINRSYATGKQSAKSLETKITETPCLRKKSFTQSGFKEFS